MFSAVKDFFATLTTILVTSFSFLTGGVLSHQNPSPSEAPANPEVYEYTLPSTSTVPIDLVPATSTDIEIPSSPSADTSSEPTGNAIPQDKKPNPEKSETAETVAPVSSKDSLNAERLSIDSLSAKARKALVNITCSSGHPSVGNVTGSGVIVDPKGIIVTNAHVAQYFLIEQESNNTDCFVRTGSPAQPAYEAELIFISPQWMARHALTFSQTYKGVNGDYDYAFLGITVSKTDEPLPESFPYIPLSSDEARVAQTVVAAGYAAEILSQSQIDENLYPTVTSGDITTTKGFLSNFADLLELPGSAVAQGGSSGGGILNAEGELLGVITLGSTAKSTADRTLTAISVNYIRRMYEREGGKTLDALFDTTTRDSIAAFRRYIPDLARPLLLNINMPSFYRIIDCDIEYDPKVCNE